MLSTANMPALLMYAPNLDRTRPEPTTAELAYELNLVGGPNFQPAIDPSETPDLEDNGQVDKVIQLVDDLDERYRLAG